MTCAQVGGVVDLVRWSPDGLSVPLATTTLDGTGEILRIDPSTMKVKRLATDVLISPGALDVGEGGTVYFGQLGDPSVLSLDGPRPVVAFTPPFEVWSRLVWTPGRFVLVGEEPTEAVIATINPTTDGSEVLYRTRDRVDSVWTDPERVRLVVAHAPYPEVDPDAGSTITVIVEGRSSDLALDRQVVASSISMSADSKSLVFVESNSNRLGSLRLSDGSVDWIKSDVDLADVSGEGRLVTARRTDDPATDQVCIS